MHRNLFLGLAVWISFVVKMFLFYCVVIKDTLWAFPHACL